MPPLDAFDRVEHRPPPEHLNNVRGYMGDAPPPSHTAQGAGGRGTNAAPKGAARGGANQKNKKGGKRTPAAPPPAPPPEKTRKKKVRQNPAKRRFRRRVAAVVLVLVLIGAGVALTVNMLFKIEGFVVEGEVPYTEAELASAFGYGVGENMYSFNAEKVAEQMQQTLPYLEKVDIRRRLPTTVLFRVTAAEETYYLPWNEQFAILSGTQKVLRLADIEPDGLVRINGIAEAVVVPGRPLEIADEAVAEALSTLLRLLQEREITDVNWVEAERATSLQFRWKGRFTVLLGTRSNLAEKLDYAMTILTDETQSHFSEADHGTLDVSSYPGSMQANYIPEGTGSLPVSLPEPEGEGDEGGAEGDTSAEGEGEGEPPPEGEGEPQEG